MFLQLHAHARPVCWHAVAVMIESGGVVQAFLDAAFARAPAGAPPMRMAHEA
jgi:hypothetical protein